MPPIFFARVPRIVFSAVLVAIFTAPNVKPQAGGASAPKIGSMHVVGAQLISADRVIAATGLKSGDRFDANRLNTVMEKLGKSGAFSDLTYTYVPQGAFVNIDFKVEEGKFRKCLFDNFVWLGKDEIDAYLRKEHPLYIGVLPETGVLLDDVAASLEKLSQEKGVRIHVERRIQQVAIGDKDWSHAFVAEGIKVPVKAVNFSGNLTVNPSDLQKEASLLIGREYSAFGTDLFGSKTITSFFADRGYLRAKVGTPAVKVLEHADGTPDFPVEIVYPITEGPLYRWQAAEWNGDNSISARDLDVLTGMKPNDIANAKRISEGWDSIKDAYAHSGYLDAKLSPEAILDDPNFLVHYRVGLAPGSQYHMGNLSVVGLPAKIEEQVRNRWKLKSNDVFDVSYAKDFVRKEFIPALQNAGLRGGKISFQMKPNRELHLVDFVLKIE